MCFELQSVARFPLFHFRFPLSSFLEVQILSRIRIIINCAIFVHLTDKYVPSKRLRGGVGWGVGGDRGKGK